MNALSISIEPLWSRKLNCPSPRSYCPCTSTRDMPDVEVDSGPPAVIKSIQNVSQWSSTIENMLNIFKGGTSWPCQPQSFDDEGQTGKASSQEIETWIIQWDCNHIAALCLTSLYPHTRCVFSNLRVLISNGSCRISSAKPASALPGYPLPFLCSICQRWRP